MNVEPENHRPTVWGACGTEGCFECLPLFDCTNTPIEGTGHRGRE